MEHWKLLAQDLSERLKSRSRNILDPDLKLEIDQAIELIRQAEVEFDFFDKVDDSEGLPSIVGQSGNISKIFTPDEIAYCQSDDKKVFIFDTEFRCYRTNSTLKEIEAKMPKLLKINQSTLVHKEQIKSIEHVEAFNHYLIKIKNGNVFRVSRRSTKKVKDVFLERAEGTS